MTSSIEAVRRGAVLEVILNRPKANAIDQETSQTLGATFANYRDELELRVAIFTGAGDRFFSAGWDMKAGAGEAAPPDQRPGGPYGVGGFGGLTELPRLYKPVIAAVNGLAIGGGLELALACDIIVAADHAEFAVPEVRYGLMADAGGVQRLPRRLPHSIAMEMLLSGRRLSAAEAQHYGLVNYVVHGNDLMKCARDVAAAIAKGAPLAIQAVKQIVSESANKTVEETFLSMRQGMFPLYGRALHSDDAKEGPRAFSEKREPHFRGT